MLIDMAASVVLVLATVVIHYEGLRVTSDLLPRLTMPPRQRMLAVLFAVFALHTVEVWLYGIGYLVVDRYVDIGDFGGEGPVTILDYVYFSTVSYTSLGFGDMYPLKGLRFVAGVEALNGLLLIGWSVSFTFLAMQEFWGLHRQMTDARRTKGDD